MPLGAGTGREGAKHRRKEKLWVLSLVAVVASTDGNLIPVSRHKSSEIPNDVLEREGFALRVCSSP